MSAPTTTSPSERAIKNLFGLSDAERSASHIVSASWSRTSRDSLQQRTPHPKRSASPRVVGGGARSTMIKVPSTAPRRALRTPTAAEGSVRDSEGLKPWVPASASTKHSSWPLIEAWSSVAADDESTGHRREAPLTTTTTTTLNSRKKKNAVPTFFSFSVEGLQKDHAVLVDEVVEELTRGSATSTTVADQPRKFAPVYDKLERELARVVHAPVPHRERTADIEADVARARDVQHIVSIVFSLVEHERCAFTSTMQALQALVKKRDKAHAQQADQRRAAAREGGVRVGARLLRALARTLIFERPLCRALGRWRRAAQGARLEGSEHAANLAEERLAWERENAQRLSVWTTKLRARVEDLEHLLRRAAAVDEGWRQKLVAAGRGKVTKAAQRRAFADWKGATGAARRLRAAATLLLRRVGARTVGGALYVWRANAHAVSDFEARAARNGRRRRAEGLADRLEAWRTFVTGRRRLRVVVSKAARRIAFGARTLAVVTWRAHASARTRVEADAGRRWRLVDAAQRRWASGRAAAAFGAWIAHLAGRQRLRRMAAAAARRMRSAATAAALATWSATARRIARADVAVDRFLAAAGGQVRRRSFASWRRFVGRRSLMRGAVRRGASKRRQAGLAGCFGRWRRACDADRRAALEAVTAALAATKRRLARVERAGLDASHRHAEGLEERRTLGHVWYAWLQAHRQRVDGVTTLARRTMRHRALRTAAVTWAAWRRKVALRGRARGMLRVAARRRRVAAQGRAWRTWSRGAAAARVHDVALSRFATQKRRALAHVAWAAWTDFCGERRRLRFLVRGAAGRWRRRGVDRAWLAWRFAFVGAARRRDADLRRRAVVAARLRQRVATRAARDVVRAWASAVRVRKRCRELLHRAMRRVEARQAGAWRAWRNAAVALRLDDEAATRSLADQRRKTRVVDQCRRRVRSLLAARALASWVDAVHSRRRERHLVGKFLARFLHATLFRAFGDWARRAAGERRLEAEAARRRRVIDAVRRRMANVTLGKTVRAWVDFVANRDRARRLARRVVTRLQQATVEAGFRTWRDEVHEARCRDVILARFFRRMRLASALAALGTWRDYVAIRVAARRRVRLVMRRSLFRLETLGQLAAWHRWVALVRQGRDLDAAAAARGRLVFSCVTRWRRGAVQLCFGHWRRRTHGAVRDDLRDVRRRKSADAIQVRVFARRASRLMMMLHNNTADDGRRSSMRTQTTTSTAVGSSSSVPTTTTTTTTTLLDRRLDGAFRVWAEGARASRLRSRLVARATRARARATRLRVLRAWRAAAAAAVATASCLKRWAASTAAAAQRRGFNRWRRRAEALRRAAAEERRLEAAVRGATARLRRHVKSRAFGGWKRHARARKTVRRVARRVLGPRREAAVRGAWTRLARAARRDRANDRAVAGALVRWRDGTLSRAFNAWVAAVARRRRVRRIFGQAVRRCLHADASGAFAVWRRAVVDGHRATMQRVLERLSDAATTRDRDRLRTHSFRALQLQRSRSRRAAAGASRHAARRRRHLVARTFESWVWYRTVEMERRRAARVGTVTRWRCAAQHCLRVFDRETSRMLRAAFDKLLHRVELWHVYLSAHDDARRLREARRAKAVNAIEALNARLRRKIFVAWRDYHLHALRCFRLKYSLADAVRHQHLLKLLHRWHDFLHAQRAFKAWFFRAVRQRRRLALAHAFRLWITAPFQLLPEQQHTDDRGDAFQTNGGGGTSAAAFGEDYFHTATPRSFFPSSATSAATAFPRSPSRGVLQGINNNNTTNDGTTTTATTTTTTNGAATSSLARSSSAASYHNHMISYYADYGGPSSLPKQVSYRADQLSNRDDASSYHTGTAGPASTTEVTFDDWPTSPRHHPTYSTSPRHANASLSSPFTLHSPSAGGFSARSIDLDTIGSNFSAADFS